MFLSLVAAPVAASLILASVIALRVAGEEPAQAPQSETPAQVGAGHPVPYGPAEAGRADEPETVRNPLALQNSHAEADSLAESTAAISAPQADPVVPSSPGAVEHPRGEAGPDRSALAEPQDVPEANSDPSGPSDLVDINAAPLEQLDALGAGRIGRAIIRGRPYASVDDLVKKRVLNRTHFGLIKDRVTVEGSDPP